MLYEVLLLKAMGAFLFTVLGILGVWFWLDCMRMRELATGIGANACRHHQVQFLDETVALSRITLYRDNSGYLRIRRCYQFEFSESGESRRKGYIVMLGAQLEVVQIEPSQTLH